jgi:hypothetical protein
MGVRRSYTTRLNSTEQNRQLAETIRSGQQLVDDRNIILFQSPMHFTSPDTTRQDKTVQLSSVPWDRIA